MSAGDHLQPDQFSPHGVGYYQRPLPGLEQIGANKRLLVEHLFKHPEIAHHPAEYNLVTQENPRAQHVPVRVLRPTQSHVEEGYVHGENTGDHEKPGAIKDKSGRYRLVDGHHKVARALLRGDKTIETLVWKAR